MEEGASVWVLRAARAEPGGGRQPDEVVRAPQPLFWLRLLRSCQGARAGTFAGAPRLAFQPEPRLLQYEAVLVAQPLTLPRACG